MGGRDLTNQIEACTGDVSVFERCCWGMHSAVDEPAGS